MTNHSGTPPTISDRAAIEALLEEAGDGWQLGQYVIAMSLERIRDGQLETTPWSWTPAGQADWMTDGLLDAVQDARTYADIDDD